MLIHSSVVPKRDNVLMSEIPANVMMEMIANVRYILPSVQKCVIQCLLQNIIM